ncbi:unnamed protein product [Owenia fusiformis]|uniref:Hexosyltransferase n=1 Tax=Owenia fusiformis TaxID=6347 RepID=A0A8J1U6L8_OWEFU|nr:unnamed protein product [Owenia fusiformis]
MYPKVTMRVSILRLLLLLFSVSFLTMVLVSRCGISTLDSFSEEEKLQGMPSYHERNIQTARETQEIQEEYERIIQVKDADHLKYTEALKAKIAELELQLEKTQALTINFTKNQAKDFTSSEKHAFDAEKYFEARINEAEIFHGVKLKTEYELVPFIRFTYNRIYLVDSGLGKRVVEKPIGYKKKELHEAIEKAVNLLNKQVYAENLKLKGDRDFVEGIYRTIPNAGTTYEMYFKDTMNKSFTPNMYHKVILSRPFGPLHLVEKSVRTTTKELINLILPLSGRKETFKHFMDYFVKICIKSDKRVFLTVVYFGTEDLNYVKSLLGQVSKAHKFKNIKLVTLNEKFSRGRGLQVGAKSWTKGDVLMFLCDVDIVFSVDFLERCRLNSERGKKVYYPMVFSLYSPRVVYSLHDMPLPSERDQLVISKDSGFWRDFGFGMTCQYRSDFINIKGFDEKIDGWGGEDVLLYRKYVKSDYIVVRATDPSIFHLWHEKVCDPTLSTDQYRSCIRSKALNEASHSQLGLLAFKDEVDLHRSYKKKLHPHKIAGKH